MYIYIYIYISYSRKTLLKEKNKTFYSVKYFGIAFIFRLLDHIFRLYM